jgi:hypothetical protein
MSSSVPSTLRVSSFLGMTRQELEAASVAQNIPVRFDAVATGSTPSNYIHAMLDYNEHGELRVMEVHVYEQNKHVASAHMCCSCFSEQTEEDGCICSLPKTYCHECSDTKCHRIHDIPVLRRRRP